MSYRTVDELDKIISKYFDYLITEYGFSVTSKEYLPKIFGNFIIRLEKNDVRITIARDRSQVFINFFTQAMGNKDKDFILEENGISRKRYPTQFGLWTGYEIDKQSIDLKQYMKLILDYVQNQ